MLLCFWNKSTRLLTFWLAVIFCICISGFHPYLYVPQTCKIFALVAAVILQMVTQLVHCRTTPHGRSLLILMNTTLHRMIAKGLLLFTSLQSLLHLTDTLVSIKVGVVFKNAYKCQC